MQKNYSLNTSTCICENGKHIKGVGDFSVTECYEIIIVMDVVLTKKPNTVATEKTNTVATNVTSTTSINYLSKNVRYWYIFQTFLLVIISLLIIIIISCLNKM